KASEFDPASFRDRYEEALLAHLKAKQAGAVPERRKTFAPPHRVVNLMEALRRSVAEDTKGAAPRKGASATRRANGRECHSAARRNAAACRQPGRHRGSGTASPARGGLQHRRRLDARRHRGYRTRAAIS